MNDDDQIWNEIAIVLNKAAAPIDVLAIRRQSAILNKEQPKLLKKLLYRKCENGLVIKHQENKRSKPLWSLSTNTNNKPIHNQQNPNNYNQRADHYNPNNNNNQQKPIERPNYINPNLNASSFNQNNYAYTQNVYNNNKNMYKQQYAQQNVIQPIDILTKYSKFLQTGNDIKYEDFYKLGGDFNACTKFIKNSKQQQPINDSHVTRGGPHKTAPKQQAQNNANNHNQPRYKPPPQLARRGRGRGKNRGRGRGRREPVAVIKKVRPKPSIPSSNAPSLPEEKKINDVEEVAINISNIISKPFVAGTLKQKNRFVLQEFYAKHIGDEYFNAYLYHIRISEDPNQCPFGILTPKPIPEFFIPHILFPIQIQKNVEQRYREHVDRVLADENEKGLSIPLKVDKGFKQNSTVRLEVVCSNGEDILHQINKNAFEQIGDVNKFWFEKLSQKPYSKNSKHSKLKLFDNSRIEKQNRFYLICPLITDNRRQFDIDYKCVQKLHIASGYATDGKKIDSTEWCKFGISNLKNELVETRQDINSKNAKERYTYSLCISYGFSRNKYVKIRGKKQEIRDDDEKRQTISGSLHCDVNEEKYENNDDVKSEIQSIASFANKSIVQRWEGMKAANKKKLSVASPKYANDHIVLLREEQPSIQNVLTAAYQKPLSGFSVQSTLKYECLEQIFPTGIKSNMWETLKNIPSILWRLENWLNVIDLHHILSNIDNNFQLLQEKDDTKINIDIDLTLLFETLHRSKISTNMNYQIFNNLGAYILKFLSTLFYFSTDISNEDDLHKQVRDIMEKTKACDTLGAVAKKYNLTAYAILYDFDFAKWNPPQFELRDKHSLYGALPCDINLADLASHLLQSIIGVYWSSVLNKQMINPLSYGINKTLQFLTRLNILGDSFQITQKMRQLNGLKMKPNDSLDKLKDFVFGDTVEMNILLYASLRTAVENCDAYTLAGITFERLEVLGDAVLDMLVVWFIFVNVGNDRNIQEVYKKNETKVPFKEFMTDGRHLFANNNSLGYHFYKKIYLPTKSEIKWGHIMSFESEIEAYSTALTEEFEGNDEKEGNDMDEKEGKEPSYYEMLKRQKSPGGYQKNENEEKHKMKSKWPLKVKAPQIFGQTFEVLLGTIFLAANCKQIFLPNEPEEHQLFHQNELCWNLKPCVEFLKKYLGNENFNDKFWQKWTTTVDHHAKHNIV